MGSRGPVARRQVSLAVEPVGKVPAPPKRLGPAGRSAWRTAWRQCSAWLTDSDAALVERCAELADERAALREAIEKTGRTTRGSQGQLVDHPLVSQLRQVEALILKTEAVLGVGPSNRFRLGIAVARAVKDASKADELLAKYRAAAEEGR